MEYPNYGASMDEYPWETGRLRRVTEMVAENRDGESGSTGRELA